jgi:hypothetical protein
MTDDRRERVRAMSWRTNAAVKPLRENEKGDPISTVQKLILIILSDYISDERGYAWVSVPRLALECLLTDRGLQKNLIALEKAGLILIERRKNQTSLYRLAPYVYKSFNMQEVVNDVHPGGEPAVTPGGEPARSPELELKEKTKNRVKAIAITYQDVFLRPLWTLTPERLKKGVTRFEEFLAKAKGDIEKADFLMRAAIKGLRASEFHMGQNDRSKRFIEWEKNLFNSQEQAEKWAEAGISLAQKQRRVAATSGNVEGGIAEIKARRAANGY